MIAGMAAALAIYPHLLNDYLLLFTAFSLTTKAVQATFKSINSVIPLFDHVFVQWPKADTICTHLVHLLQSGSDIICQPLEDHFWYFPSYFCYEYAFTRSPPIGIGSNANTVGRSAVKEGGGQN